MSKLIPTNQDEWWYTLVPVISNAHITKDDCAQLQDPDLLCNPDSNKWLMDVDGGWLINLREVPVQQFSEAFRTMVERLRADGHSFVRLDKDADQVQGLPTFEW